MARIATAAAAKDPIRKNDTVMVIKGRDRGKTGKVLRVLPDRGRVLIERLNLVKRHHEAARRRKSWRNCRERSADYLATL